MKYEEHGCIDINKLQEIENQKIEEKMQKKFKKGFTPSHNVQKPISSKDFKSFDEIGFCTLWDGVNPFLNFFCIFSSIF